jgi:hypothetical protein
MMGQIAQQKDKRIITSTLVPKIPGALLTIFQKAFQKKALKTVLDHEKAKANFH